MNKKYKSIAASVSIALAVGGGALAISLNRDTEKVPSVSFESKAELEADEPFGELPENLCFMNFKHFKPMSTMLKWTRLSAE